jgi:hypothetical protein
MTSALQKRHEPLKVAGIDENKTNNGYSVDDESSGVRWSRCSRETRLAIDNRRSSILIFTAHQEATGGR